MFSRIRLLTDAPFYGMVMMNMKVYLGDSKKDVWIESGDILFFNPHYLQEVGDYELDKTIVRVLDEFVEQVISDSLESNEDEDDENKPEDEEKDSEDDSTTSEGDSEDVKESGEEDEDAEEDVAEAGDGGLSDSEAESDKFNRDIWLNRIRNITKTISIESSSASMGGVPLFAQRLLKQLNKSQINWREVINNFIQEEIMDYTFTPPDRRFDDSPFFLPDYNVIDEEAVSDIWFVVDTSGSISDDAIAAAYSEISNAIIQFNGKLKGILSFTESYVTDPVPFSTVEELMNIKPVGGGGNDFSDIFRYLKDKMIDNLPAQIIIITDGYDDFPEEEMAMGIPVLWLINNDKVNPPWGKVARIKV